MQVSNYKKNGMQEGNESSVRKVNKKVSNAKMNKSQNPTINSSSTADNLSESPQNARLESSESDEESVSEESFPHEPEDDISTEEFPEDESCESENEQDEDVSDEDDEEESGDDQEENSDDDADATTDEEHSNIASSSCVGSGVSGGGPRFLLNIDDDHPHSKKATIDAMLEAAAVSKDKKGNPVIRSATAALEETAQTITRMRTERNDSSPRDKTLLSRTLIAACTDNDVNAVRRLLVEGNNLNEATDDGDSLLSLACSAGYYELAQVLLAMSAQVEDRGQKNDCTPLMEAASAGHIDIIELLIRHEADVNAQSSTGNTPLMYACAGGHVEAVKVLLAHGAKVEDHNENGHTPLMEAASAGHVAVAKILLEHGAGINTHSNEFKESALTLACYKGHLDMVRFLLEAGADQEHKTDEMHTALMEASMDGHVEVARLLLDSGAQVNMPTDSFESPLTLAACGGHVDLAMLLIERGANIEEVNDEGYTPLMEAAREGHEEMVSLLLTQGANINAQTEETQETALTLACCGGFLEVADYLIKHGADIELGASTPLMEAAQEGHLELVKFLLDNKADVHAQTQTGDTALTYACENGHTDVAEVLLYFGAELEHLSEGGRTPLMKACRAGHICTVKFLIQKGADVNRQTTNNDHTPLSLACAGGHQQVVELLLAHGADPYHKLKDNSTMLIEAAKGGHTGVVQLLLDYPTSIPPPQSSTHYIPTPMNAASQLNMAKMNQQQLKLLQQQQQHQILAQQQAAAAAAVAAQQQQQQFMVAPPGLHHETHQHVAEVIHSNIRLQEPPGMFPTQIAAEMLHNPNFILDPNVMSAVQQQQASVAAAAAAATESSIMTQMKILQSTGFKDGLAYGLTKGQSAVSQIINQQNNTNNMNVAPCSDQQQQQQQQAPHQTLITNNLSTCMPSSSKTTTSSSSSNKQKNISRKKGNSALLANSATAVTTATSPLASTTTQIDSQQVNELTRGTGVGEEETSILNIKSSLDKLDNTLQKNIQFINDSGPPPTLLPSATLLPTGTYVDITTAAQNKGVTFTSNNNSNIIDNNIAASNNNNGNQVQLITQPSSGKSQITAKSEVSQSTAIKDRPKAVPKNSRKHQQLQQQQQQAQSGINAFASIDLTQNIINNNSKAHQQVNPLEALVNKIESESKSSSEILSQDALVPPQKPVSVPEVASSSSSTNSYNTSSLQTITAAALALDEKEKSNEMMMTMTGSSSSNTNSSSSNNIATAARTCSSLVDFEAFQKMPLNNLSNRSAHWDPKVFRKIAQLIDPPKSPPETPDMRSYSPDEAMRLEHELTNQELKVLLEEAMSYKKAGGKGRNQSQQQIHHHNDGGEGLEKTLATFRSINAEDFVCDGNYPTYPTLEESFNPDDIVATGDDGAGGPMYNYEWVDEVMQALNVSPDISSAFHEIAANINNQDLEQYANFFGLNKICQSKWATPHWPAQHHHQITSEGSSPTNENDENIILHESGEGEDGKHHTDDSNLLVIDQTTGYPPQFTMEQLQLLSQLQQQHPLLQIDPQTAQSILMPTIPPPPLTSPAQMHHQQQMKSLADAQQQTKFVFNVDNNAPINNASAAAVQAGDKASQSLQLLFQLPTDQQQQQQQQNNQQMLKITTDLNQKVQQNAVQTQTMHVPAQTTTNMQIPPPSAASLQSGFLNFQLQQQQQQNQSQQKVHQMPQFFNKTNYQQTTQQQQQVQVATQTSTHQHHQHPAAESLPHATPTSGKPIASIKKSVSSDNQKRKEKSSRYGSNNSNGSARSSASNQNQYQYDQQLQFANNNNSNNNNNVPGSTSTGTTIDRSIEIDSETDSNHDTALTLACAGGHEELVELLLKRKANIEHRDKKGFTPLILAATAGHEKVVEILINNGADLEAQSERTKDTPLSLACSGGRYEVVELLLKYNANKEHRNVSDYTPLSLAASGGYVNIIKLLLNQGAEINSRTGSKLGISPLMLAAMNGHTTAVRLLLDMGSDINAQIETNRNTALTLACFQGRHEVVSHLLDRKANVEHRAKTGLTPLMEAASGGYIEVGRVLLDKGADVNAAPVPSSRDTALTIAADKGHLKFVELLLSRGAAVEVKNKKGNSPLWLAANGGHLGVVEALYHAKADIDSQDNRKVSCLMAAFKKGHVKVVKWMVNHVAQFPSDQEMTRQISVVDKEVVDKCHECVKIIRAAKETQAKKAKQNADILLKELDMEKSREDARKAAAAKRRERKKRRKQEKKEAQRKANENANDSKSNQQQQQQGKGKNNQKSPQEEPEESEESEEEEDEEEENFEEYEVEIIPDREFEGDSGIDQGSCSSSDAKGSTVNQSVTSNNTISTSSSSTAAAKANDENHQQQQQYKNQKNNSTKNNNTNNNNNNRKINAPASTKNSNNINNSTSNVSKTASNRSSSSPVPISNKSIEVVKNVRNDESKRSNREQKNQRSADLTTKSSSATIKPTEKENVAPAMKTRTTASTTIVESKSYENSSRTSQQQQRKSFVFGNNSRSSGADDYEIDYFKATAIVTSTTNSKPKTTMSPIKSSSLSVPNSATKQPREEEWKEVGKKPATSSSTSTSTSTTSSANEIGCKKIQVPLNAISRVIGRGGSNINAIRAATGAHIEVEKQGKTQGDRSITIKGVPDATKLAHSLISTLIKDPDADILSMLPRNNFPSSTSSNSSSSSTTQQSQAPIVPLTTNATIPSSSAPRSTSSTNIISPSAISAINNGTSVWEKSRDMVPTISNPVKPASSYIKPMTSNGKSTTPTQQMSKTPRSVAKNLFTSTSSAIMRPTPIISSSSTASSSTKILVQDGTKKGITNGPPSSSTSNPIGSKLKNSTFASKLSGNVNEIEGLPPPFTHNNQNVVSSSNATQSTTLTRSITPIGPPTRNYNASPHSSHIVNTLDLSTPYNNDITTQIQSKLSELHVSAQSGLEYSLFDMGRKWNQEQTNVFSHPLSVAEAFAEPPLQVDASKAPGYRGGGGAGASINSPVSSKTSSNSATPPSTILATQAPITSSSQSSQASGNYGGGGTIGSGASQRQQSSQQQQQQQSSFNRSPGVNALYDGSGFNNSNTENSYNRQMNYNMNQTAAMSSRLNPQASAFSSSNIVGGNKMQQNPPYGQSSQYNNNNNSNNNFLKSPGSQQPPQQQQQTNYQRGSTASSSNSSSSTSGWFSDLSSTFRSNAGMNVMSDFIQSSSPSMSPNNNTINAPNLSGLTSTIEDSRKAPPPIGTERHNFNKYMTNCYQHYPGMTNDMDFSSAMINQIGMPPPNSWIDKNTQQQQQQQQWQMQSNVPIVPRNNNPYDNDYNMTPDLFQQQYSMDHAAGYMRNGAPYHPNLYMNDLSNLSTDLPPTSYDKQPWASKWTQ